MERKHVYPVRKSRMMINNILSDKPKLFILVSVIVVSALSFPLIIPHINHPQHIYHIILHIASLILSIFLFIVSISSVLQKRWFEIVVHVVRVRFTSRSRDFVSYLCCKRYSGYHGSSSQY